MKKLSLILLLFVMLVAPALAQEEETRVATFGDETGVFTLQYPADLHVVGASFWEASQPPVPMAIFMSSPDMFDRSTTPPYTPLAMGEWGMAVVFFPKAMFLQMGVAEDASLIDLATAYEASFGESGQTTIEPHLVTLENGAEAVVMAGRGDDGAGGPPVEDLYLMLHEIADGVILMTTVVSAVDGRTDEMIAAHLALTNSVEFSGTADEILAGMTPAGQ